MRRQSIESKLLYRLDPRLLSDSERNDYITDLYFLVERFIAKDQASFTKNDSVFAAQVLAGEIEDLIDTASRWRELPDFSKADSDAFQQRWGDIEYAKSFALSFAGNLAEHFRRLELLTKVTGMRFRALAVNMKVVLLELDWLIGPRGLHDFWEQFDRSTRGMTDELRTAARVILRRFKNRLLRLSLRARACADVWAGSPRSIQAPGKNSRPASVLPPSSESPDRSGLTKPLSLAEAGRFMFPDELLFGTPQQGTDRARQRLKRRMNGKQIYFQAVGDKLYRFLRSDFPPNSWDRI